MIANVMSWDSGANMVCTKWKVLLLFSEGIMDSLQETPLHSLTNHSNIKCTFTFEVMNFDFKLNCTIREMTVVIR